MISPFFNKIADVIEKLAIPIPTKLYDADLKRANLRQCFSDLNLVSVSRSKSQPMRDGAHS